MPREVGLAAVPRVVDEDVEIAAPPIGSGRLGRHFARQHPVEGIEPQEDRVAAGIRRAEEAALARAIRTDMRAAEKRGRSLVRLGEVGEENADADLAVAISMPLMRI